MLRIALIGAGRMGQAIIGEIGASAELDLAGVCVRDVGKAAVAGVPAGVPVAVQPDDILSDADVVIDFSLPDACPVVVAAAVKAGKPLVCGVTGLDEGALAALQTASNGIPVLYERNMSFGIAVLARLVEQAATALGSDYSASIAEVHHRHKRDAPSGTALNLGEVLASARGEEFQAVYHYDPDGRRGEPPAGKIVYKVSRHGENPGEHTVRFATDYESLELAHQATNRRVFAQGALRAAAWLVRQRNGYYRLRDVTV